MQLFFKVDVIILSSLENCLEPFLFLSRLGLEIIPMLDHLPALHLNVQADLVDFIRQSKDRSSADDYSTRSSLNSMFAGPDGPSSIKILPTIEEFEQVCP